MVSQGTLSDLERGTCFPSSDTIAALRVAFQCDLNWLFERSGTEESDTFTINASSKEKELIELFRILIEEDKEELIEIGKLKAKKRK